MKPASGQEALNVKRPPVMVRWVLSILLIIGAAALVISQRDNLSGARRSLAEADPLLVTGLLTCVILNIFFTSLLYWVLTRPYAEKETLRFRDMAGMICAAGLLNYLPLRAGLLGRVAYQKTRFGITVKSSTLTVMQAVGLSGVTALSLVAAAASGLLIYYFLFLPVAVGLIFWRVGSGGGMYSRLGAALIIRQFDAFAWVGRYYLVFSLLGKDVPLAAACAVAGVGMLASFVPFTSNGLGLREWAVGLTAAVLPAGWIVAEKGTSVTSLAVGADLCNRAGELIVIVPLGILVLWLQMRRNPPTDRGEC